MRASLECATHWQPVTRHTTLATPGLQRPLLCQGGDTRTGLRQQLSQARQVEPFGGARCAVVLRFIRGAGVPGQSLLLGHPRDEAARAIHRVGRKSVRVGRRVQSPGQLPADRLRMRQRHHARRATRRCFAQQACCIGGIGKNNMRGTAYAVTVRVEQVPAIGRLRDRLHPRVPDKRRATTRKQGPHQALRFDPCRMRMPQSTSLGGTGGPGRHIGWPGVRHGPVVRIGARAAADGRRSLQLQNARGHPVQACLQQFTAGLQGQTYTGTRELRARAVVQRTLRNQQPHRQARCPVTGTRLRVDYAYRPAASRHSRGNRCPGQPGTDHGAGRGGAVQSAPAVAAAPRCPTWLEPKALETGVARPVRYKTCLQ